MFTYFLIKRNTLQIHKVQQYTTKRSTKTKKNGRIRSQNTNNLPHYQGSNVVAVITSNTAHLVLS